MAENAKPLSKQDQLKKINADKKALNDKQKALREELNAGKVERTEARKVQAAVRKEVRDQKSELRDMSAKIYDTFSSGDVEAIGKLADGIMEVSAELAGTVRKFGEATKTLNEL